MQYESKYTFESKIERASKMATFTLRLNRSPNIRIRGPVTLFTEGFKASGVVKETTSPNSFALCSFKSGPPFKIPSLYTGYMALIP